ncbi:hypothetical protein F4801DRAFT_536139 [Xylaria longipes]|nr:hypothetical protein F4801DRAFT_536139 [Xylaria longipes]
MANPMESPIVAHTPIKIQDVLELTDESLLSEFGALGVSHVDMSEPNTEDMWLSYLNYGGYVSAFMPFDVAERDRYDSIIKNSASEEKEESNIAGGLVNSLASVPVEVVRKVLPLKQYIIDSGRSYLDRYGPMRRVALEDVLHYSSRPPRHVRQRPQLPTATYNTKWGSLTAYTTLAGAGWYAGHRPGDPIIRILNHPTGSSPPGDIHDVYFEGVVPFTTDEMRQRFVKDAFPNLVRMVIVALGFDPKNPDHSHHPYVTVMERIIALEFDEVQERVRANTLKLLRRCWHIKYGADTNGYPHFLTSQICSTISKFQEMGWLMSQLEAGQNVMTRRHFWTHCKSLVQDITGNSVDDLASQYYNIQLTSETEILLWCGTTDDMLIWKASDAGQDPIQVCVALLSGLILKAI